LTLVAFVERATKCLATCLASPAFVTKLKKF